MRAEWDIESYLRNGRLVQVLPQYSTPEADIYAVYHVRHQLLSRVRLFVDLMAGRLRRLGTERAGVSCAPAGPGKPAVSEFDEISH